MALRPDIPPGLTADQTIALASCVTTLMCPVAVAACTFAPIANVSGGLANLVDSGGSSPAVSSTFAFTASVALCLVLVLVSNVVVVAPLVGDPGPFTYAERLPYVPLVARAEHAGYVLAALLAAFHCVRVYGPSPCAALFDAVHPADAEALAVLLGAGADSNASRDEEVATPMHIGAASGDVGVVPTLLAGDAEPETLTSPSHPTNTRLELGAVAH